ncbi:MAG: PQQ-binding-like beta-propeller repeat protein [Verrucomicrobiota bacterium]
MLSPPISRVNTTLLATLATISFSSTFADDWPIFRGLDRNGIAKADSIATSGAITELWSAKVGLGYSAPVVSEGRLVITGHDGSNTDTVFCFDEATGTELWKFSYDQPLGNLYFQGGTTGTLTFDGDKLYHVAREGEVFCLNAKDGSVVWKRNLQEEFDYSKPTWGFTGAPLVMGDRVYLTAGEAGIALNKNDGSEIWKSKNEEAGYASPFPIERGGTQYLIFTNKRFYVCVKAETGEIVWEYRWMTRYGVNAADPVVSGNSIFISSGYGKGAVLLDWDGSGKPDKVWQNRDLRTQMNAAVLIDGFLYGVDGNESVDGTGLKCLDFATGETLWTETSIGHGTVSAVGNQLVVLSEMGALQIGPASPAGFQPAVSSNVVPGRVWTVPVVANGKVFARNASGQLAAVKVGKDS